MNRARGLALLALGVALAAAAAGTGPYLASRDVPPFRFSTMIERARARETEAPDVTVSDGLPLLDQVLRVVLMVLIGVVALAALLAFLRWAVRGLAELRLRRSAGRRSTDAYDSGEESGEDAETALRQRLAADLTALSADLDTVGDPREVVIACYVRMERAFAQAGSARRPDESPMELLVRVLAEQHVPEEDVRRLTGLFTEARFSRHPVTDEMRAAARRSLNAVADALAVPA